MNDFKKKIPLLRHLFQKKKFKLHHSNNTSIPNAHAHARIYMILHSNCFNDYLNEKFTIDNNCNLMINDK